MLENHRLDPLVFIVIIYILYRLYCCHFFSDCPVALECSLDYVAIMVSLSRCSHIHRLEICPHEYESSVPVAHFPWNLLL